MKKDIEIPKVTDISIAVVREWNEDKTAEVYNVYLINKKKNEIENVLVTAKGYGVNKESGEKLNTSLLRHFLGNVPAKSAVKIEPIMEEVFGINNEYWLSFFENNKMYDKKFIFLAETIIEENRVEVPYLKEKGVVI